jgi:hypothetical protein
MTRATRHVFINGYLKKIGRYKRHFLHSIDTIVDRPVDEQQLMQNCWNASKSTGLIVASTRSQSEDQIKFKLLEIPKDAQKTSVRYSILVKQHTLTDAEYQYLELMEKNSTQLGSLFDPQPSQLYGNIKNVEDPDEMVVGYVGVYTTEEKRMFILKSELPGGPLGNGCLSRLHRVAPIFKINDQDSLNKYLRPNQYYVPYQTWRNNNDVWMQLIQKPCVDCRLFGTTVKPDFW